MTAWTTAERTQGRSANEDKTVKVHEERIIRLHLASGTASSRPSCASAVAIGNGDPIFVIEPGAWTGGT